MNNLTETVAELVKQADNQEQYSRRNCLLVHGLFETTLENTDDRVITMFKIIGTSKFCRMTLTDRIELGSKRMTPTQLGQSLLNSRGTMTEIRFSEIKKRLKGKKMSITERLTGLRMSMLKEARDEFGFRNVWSTDSRILYKEEGSDQTRVHYE